MDKLEHIAFIMDGNRRWEAENNLKKYDGYKKGTKVITTILEKALELEINHISVYAFSSENWQRPLKDIAALMKIGVKWLDDNLDFMMQKGIKCTIIGNRALLPFGFLSKAEYIEELTKDNKNLSFHIAISYGSRDEVIRALNRLKDKFIKNASFELNEENFSQFLDTNSIPDPDLLIRTGGQKRLSNYMLWQMAYTEFMFIDKLWPDFSACDFQKCIDDFYEVDRRFGIL